MKILIYRATYGGGDNKSAFQSFQEGALACGDDCEWTNNLNEDCDVAVHPSGPKAGSMARGQLSINRQTIIDRYPDTRIVIESPCFRTGIKALRKSGTRYWRIGWNGFLRGEADYMNENSPHGRWKTQQREHGIVLEPSRLRPGVVLVMLQKRTDASVRNVDINKWAASVQRVAQAYGLRSVLRQHPLELLKGRQQPTIEKALSGASIVVTYTSLSAIESVCAGIPTFANKKSLAYPVCSPRIDYLRNPLIPADSRRLQWLADLAYTQWTEQEISSGAVWDRYRKRMA